MKYTINDIKKCERFLDKFRAGKWRVWQMQYRWSDPEGFHAWFIKGGEKDIEVITYSEEVQKAIVSFEP